MTAPDRLDRILALMRLHRPQLRLVAKADIWWMVVAGRLLRWTTPGFMTRFTTVIGDVVYLPRPAEEMDRQHLARILCHEFIHQLDMAEYGLGFYLSYAVLPFPVVRSYRAYWERRGYAVDLMLAFERGGKPAMDETLAWSIPLFAGPAYGWMHAPASSAEAYLTPVAEDIEAGILQKKSPYREILAAYRGDET